MTSVLNLFSNFDDLSKKKTINDYACDFKEKKLDDKINSPSMTQGEKYNKYQNKIKKNLEKKIYKSGILEGFEKLNLSNNGLTMQTDNVIKSNDYSSQQTTIENLRSKYEETLKTYKKLIATITGVTTEYLDRVNTNNPYLGKNVCLTGGACGYVTNQGVFKWYPSDNNYTYNSTAGKNGCPSTPYMQIDGPITSGNERTPGSVIGSNPKLIVGTPMVAGQSCGNEGENVFVNSLVKDPTQSYLGCYNNLPQVTTVRYNPVMGPTNEANGFRSYASTIYHSDNNSFGPWKAFDDNMYTWWHSFADSDGWQYQDGKYIGNNSISYIDANGSENIAKGDFLQLDNPNYSLIPLVKYDILGRLDCCGSPNGRDPGTWYILGWNPSEQKWYEVDYHTNESFNYKSKTFTVPNPKPYGSYLIITTIVGDGSAPADQRTCVQISTWTLYTTSDYVNTSKPSMTNVGKMTVDQCSQYALTSGNQFFGLQEVDNNGVGNCMISNTQAGLQVYGDAYTYVPVAIWSSNTGGNSGIASLSNNGTLSVYNSTGQSIFSTDSSTAKPGNYIGCYNDCYGGRALPTPITLGNNAGSTYDSCSTAATNGNWKYFGLQYTQPSGTSECWVGNDIGAGRAMGKATNCFTQGGTEVGSVCSNAIFSTNPTEGSFYYLALQDDGNMCIYRGSSPNDYQGTIFCTMTNGQQKEPNPNFAAKKGKTGEPYMLSGMNLAPGEFIGSNDGSIYLIMQTDGNLVLYTSTRTTACSASAAVSNMQIGNSNVNSVYKLDTLGNKNEIGKLAYIDENSKLHQYPTNNRKENNEYSLVATGIDSWGNDIPGAAYGGATLESCKTSCNENPNCGGFVMDNARTTCWPKTPSFYPNGNIGISNDRNIYYRSQSPISPPFGASETVKNTDTITYQNYINGGNFDTSYGLANATSIQKQQLADLESQMNLLSSQIVNLTGKFGNSSSQAETQAIKNVRGLKGYLQDYKGTNTKISEVTIGVDNILNDSDIVVLQKNYNYLFWSILATGAVLVTMNIVKK